MTIQKSQSSLIDVLKSRTTFLVLASLWLCSSEVLSQNSPYSFFLAGHVYGTPSNNDSGVHPLFLQRFDEIAEEPNLEFGVFLGDIAAQNPTLADWEAIDQDIERLGVPVHFAAGNHDVINRDLFESLYGPTYYHFLRGSDLFIVLDPNIDGWNISGEQLDFFQSTLFEIAPSCANVFVFFHQVLWRENDNIYSHVMANSSFGRDTEINFWPQIEPMLRCLDARVFLACGDVGAGDWSVDFMYDSYDNITLLATGMGEGVGDNYIHVNVDESGEVELELVCLDDSDSACDEALESYRLSSSPLRMFNESVAPELFPNPASTSVALDFCSVDQRVIRIVDLNGKVLLEQSAARSRHTLDLVDLDAGAYLVEWSSADARGAKVLLIEH